LGNVIGSKIKDGEAMKESDRRGNKRDEIGRQIQGSKREREG